jgi:hypothetical protein
VNDVKSSNVMLEIVVVRGQEDSIVLHILGKLRNAVLRSIANQDKNMTSMFVCSQKI